MAPSLSRRPSGVLPIRRICFDAHENHVGGKPRTPARPQNRVGRRFARVEGVEPTNNAAERALRHAVLWRKTSHGTDSEAGSRFVENILSIVATCRQQGRDVLEYLTLCCEAALRGERPPRLIPREALQ